MRTLIFFALLAIAFSGRIINRRVVDHLKKVAPFQVYDVDANPFKDWTDEEIRSMLSLKIRKTHKKPQAYKRTNAGYDFRTEHPECIRGIHDQAQCGSCWAFGATTSLEERFCLHSGGSMKPTLAPQDPVSCDDMDMGCNGGALLFVWMYLSDYGVVEEECWPYSSGQGYVEPCRNTCPTGKPWKKYYAGDYAMLAGVSQIREDLVANGPVNSQFMVYSDFMNYQGGIYEYTWGDQEGGHATVILGYGAEGDKDYWICQNSWGPNWGEQGYFRIKFGECIIDQAAIGGIPLI